MRKKKIYLDTSAVSYLRQEDTPIQMAETLEFWDILKMERYDVSYQRQRSMSYQNAPSQSDQSCLNY